MEILGIKEQLIANLNLKKLDGESILDLDKEMARMAVQKLKCKRFIFL